MIEKQYKTIGPRIGARFIDGFIYGLAVAIISLLIMLFRLQIDDILEIAAFILYPVYNAWFLYRYGQTLGKSAVKIKVISENDHPIGFWQALEREFVLLIPFALFRILQWFNLGLNHKAVFSFETVVVIVFFALLLSNKQRKSYHDLAAKTMVVKILD